MNEIKYNITEQTWHDVANEDNVKKMFLEIYFSKNMYLCLKIKK